jgi:hypothetical protein
MLPFAYEVMKTGLEKIGTRVNKSECGKMLAYCEYLNSIKKVNKFLTGC